MNLLSRARLSGRIRLSSLYSTSSLQQWNSYSTSRTPKSTNPKSPKSPSSLSEKMMKPTGKAIVWPKPSEIPYQAKVANFVTLIGYVKAPVQFDSAPDGFSAATAIAQGGNDSLLIPVVFEGDLAYVVATHVKENSCILVSGQLSSEPSRFALEEGFGKFHVACENLNFVQGFQSGFPRTKSVGVKKAEDGGIRNVVEGVSDDKFDHKWEKALEEAKAKKFLGEENWGSNVGSKGAMWGTGEPTIERGEGAESGVKKKDGDQWRDLVRNSPNWRDFRDQKAKGLKGEKFPDFKHKQTGDALWMNRAPTWVLPGIEKLAFDAPVATEKPVQRSQGFGEEKPVQRSQGFGEEKPVQRSQGSGEEKSSEEAWKDLVENPSKWWDNRTNKLNPKGPDFRHKETKQGLWLNKSPDWALSKLPPLN